MADGLVYRYDPAASPDGLGDEGTFKICSFWYVEALARAGRLDEARLLVREDAQLRQPPRPVLRADRQRGEPLGQLPQAFTHLALISAALTSTDNSGNQEELAGQHLEHGDYGESIVAAVTPVDGAEVDLLTLREHCAAPHQLVQDPQSRVAD